MMAWLQSVTLHNDCVTLAPLATSHVDALIEATSDGELWNLWYTHVPRPQDMAAEIARRRQLQDEGAMLPFAVIDTDGIYLMLAPLPEGKHVIHFSVTGGVDGFALDVTYTITVH